MSDTMKDVLVGQFEAALCMLNACINRCPERLWNEPVGNLSFCQIAFHALFFADLYLGRDDESLQTQQFHRDNESSFRDYEELEDRPQQLLYDRAFIRSYLQHCRSKALETIAAETPDSLAENSRFPRRDFSRAELYVYNLRHIQHHAAQLSLHLRIHAQQQIPWIGSMWQDT